MTDAKAEYVPSDNIFRVIVAGGRDFNDYSLLSKTLDKALAAMVLSKQIVIISGTARGADTLGERYAKERGYEIKRMPADWDAYGKRAGYLRNVAMAEAADALVAFWDYKSRGTANMISIAQKRDLPHKVILY